MLRQRTLVKTVKSHALVVDDNDLVRQSLTSLLAAFGFSVTAIKSADDARELAPTFMDSVDVLLTDYEMPGTDGLTFATCIKQQHPEIRIVVMSGKIQSIEKEVSHLGGRLQKPFTAIELQEQLDVANSRSEFTKGTSNLAALPPKNRAR